jgi:carbon-monoxide dehydrogenase medium subunit
MLPREVDYARPTSLPEALGLLATSDGARALAGGQTLVSVMKARVASPDALVDLGALEELKGIELRPDGSLEIGAMTTLAEIIDSSEARARPVLREVCAQIADPQVRNRGTIGGNICANDPTNHLPPLMVALGASMTVLGPGGERSVPADDFFLGVYMTAVSTGELLTRVTIPAGRRDGFASVTIGVQGTCLVSAAASLENGPRIAIGCVAAVPYRPREIETRVGQYFPASLLQVWTTWSTTHRDDGGIGPDEAKAAVHGLAATLDPPSDVHGSGDYRRALAEVVVVRAIVRASERGTR